MASPTATENCVEAICPEEFLRVLREAMVFILTHFSLILYLGAILYSINIYFDFLDIQKFAC